MALRKVFLFSSFFFLLAALSLKAPTFEVKKIKLGSKVISVEIADSEETRRYGLMNRTSLPPDSGMLFIFDVEQPLSFWMKNTLIPLSIGYFNSEKKLVDIQDMQPEPSMILDQNLKNYESKKPAKYALEMPLGWFARNKVQVGATFEFQK